MTECNRQGLLFSSLGRQQVQADFAGGTLTSDAGGLLLREVDRRTGLLDALTACLSDPRDPARITHDRRTMLAQRVCSLSSARCAQVTRAIEATFCAARLRLSGRSPSRGSSRHTKKSPRLVAEVEVGTGQIQFVGSVPYLRCGRALE